MKLYIVGWTWCYKSIVINRIGLNLRMKSEWPKIVKYKPKILKSSFKCIQDQEENLMLNKFLIGFVKVHRKRAKGIT